MTAPVALLASGAISGLVAREITTAAVSVAADPCVTTVGPVTALAGPRPIVIVATVIVVRGNEGSVVVSFDRVLNRLAVVVCHRHARER
jgi:hypothetical protein